MSKIGSFPFVPFQIICCIELLSEFSLVDYKKEKMFHGELLADAKTVLAENSNF